MLRGHVAVALAALVVVAIPLPASGLGTFAQSEPTPLLDGEGSLSLAELAGSSEPVVLDGATPVWTVDYELPAEAAQEQNGIWYSFEMIATVESITLDTRRERVYLSAATNGAATAQIEFERTGPNEPVTWSTTNFVDGAFGGELVDERTLVYENYLQRDGVRPGRNELRLEVETVDGAAARIVVDSVRSRLVAAASPPQDFAFAVSEPGEAWIAMGDQFSVDFTVDLYEDRAAEDVVVAAIPERGGVVVLESAEVRWPELRQSRSGRFRLQAVEPGDFVLVVSIQSGSNASNRFAFEVTGSVAEGTPPHSSRRVALGVAAVSLLLIAGGAATLVTGRRRPDGT